MKRNVCSSFCETAFPIILCVILLVVQFVVKPTKNTNIVEDWEFLESNSTAEISSGSEFYGLGGPTNFWSSCQWRTKYGIAGNNSLTRKLQRKINRINPIYFKDMQEMEAYVKAKNYSTPGIPELCFGFSLDQLNENNYNYTINFFVQSFSGGRQNAPNTQDKSVEELQSKPDLASFNLWTNSGYLKLVKVINDLILQETTKKTRAKMDFGVLAQNYTGYETGGVGGIFTALLPFFLVIAFMGPLVILVYRIVNEKETRSKEGMKMMGLTDSVYFLSWFIQYLVRNVIISLLCAVILTYVLTYIPFIVFFLIFFLYGMNIFAFAYFLSSFLEKTRFAVIFAIIIYFIFYFLSFVVGSEYVSEQLKMLISLLIPTCLSLGFNGLIYFQSFEKQFVLSEHLFYLYQNYSVGNMIIMFIVDFFVFLFLGWYLDNVIQHEFGTPKPFYFLFTTKYWCGEGSDGTVNNDKSFAERNALHSQNKENFQEEGNYEEYLNSGDCLKLNNLVKKFDDGKVAVNNLSLNVFKNEIFALLGHNGAGKSTTINLLTGLYAVTEGEALYKNRNVFENMDEWRKTVGICPQHDILFEDLTVREHLELFCVFKGLEGDKMDPEVNKVIDQMDINDIQDKFANTLSGGQKRKLSIAIALVGGSEVVFLDEPSSGMDITSRRKLWNILKDCTNERIIVLTTHYMEEAAVLGNRVGIVSDGQMQCCGTPLFLTSKFGKYINLTINMEQITAAQGIIAFMQAKFQDIKFEIFSEEINFQIIKSSELNLRQFFSDLDENVTALKIKSYNASMPSLEDVFLGVANADHEKKRKIREQQGIIDAEVEVNDLAYTYNRNADKEISASAMFCTHLSSSFTRRFYQIIRDSKTFGMEIIGPIVMVLVGIACTSIAWNVDSPQKDMNFNLMPFKQNPMVNKIPYYLNESDMDNNFLTAYDKNITQYNITTDIAKKANVSTTIIAYNKQIQKAAQAKQYGNYYMITMNKAKQEYEFVLISNTVSQDAVPIFLQEMLTNIIRNANNNPNININFGHRPLPITYDQLNRANRRNESTLIFFIAIAFALIPSSFITIIIRERTTNMKHLQVISGISYTAYWFSNFLFEIIKYFITAGIIMIILWGFDRFPDYVYSLIILHGMSMVPFTYMLSFIFKTEFMGQIIIIVLNFIIGSLFGSLFIVLRILEDTKNIAVYLAYILRTIPAFSFAYGYNCLLAFRSIVAFDNPNDILKDVDQLDINYVGLDVIYLGTTAIFYIIGLCVLEYFYSVAQTPPTHSTYNLTKIQDEHVKTEIAKANDEEFIGNKKLTDGENYSVRLKNLERIYSEGCGGMEKQAIDKLSLCLNYGECFALLGVNGAGKTTTFKCLTNEISPTAGQIFIDGMEITDNFSEIRNLIGYCPQFDAIFDYLTVHENLDFYAKIKGVSEEHKEKLIDSLMTELNLSQYRDKISGNLSGGNKRKLSVGIAMISNPPIMLLDEPSTGMDPESRKFMWSVIHKITQNRKQSSVILTTHSMEEAESLCRRIGIMVNGQFKCLGTSQEIKDIYGSGYEIPIRLKNNTDENLANLAQHLATGLDTKLDVITAMDVVTRLDKTYLNYFISENDNLGSDILKDLKFGNKTTLKKLLNWIYYTENLLKFLKILDQSYKNIKVVQYLENNFTIEVAKEKGYSIGYMFGQLEDLKNDCEIQEYSISLTSLEKIFNMFAFQEEKNEVMDPDYISLMEEQSGKTIHKKKELLVDNYFLNQQVNQNQNQNAQMRLNDNINAGNAVNQGQEIEMQKIDNQAQEGNTANVENNEENIQENNQQE